VLTTIEHTNIIFIKSPKTGSSTTGGLARRIGAHHNLGNWNGDNWIISRGSQEPGVFAEHATLKDLLPKIFNLTMPYFLFTFIREPAERCLSDFYHFKVSRGHFKPTEQQKLSSLRGCNNYQARYITPVKSVPEDHAPSLREIINWFDFIGVTNRFEESMLVLAYLLNLSYCDILYIKTKDSNSKYFRRDEVGYLLTPHPHILTEEKSIIEYANSSIFFQRNEIDYGLYKYANRQIDNIINTIGVSNFKLKLEKYRKLLTLSLKICVPLELQDKPPNKVLKCYEGDMGCGYDCLDKICHISEAYEDFLFQQDNSIKSEILMKINRPIFVRPI
jgi:hypothetical protein